MGRLISLLLVTTSGILCFCFEIAPNIVAAFGVKPLIFSVVVLLFGCAAVAIYVFTGRE
jgi:predicted naringenin-chalcone synthase